MPGPMEEEEWKDRMWFFLEEGDDESDLELYSYGSCTTLKYSKNHSILHSKRVKCMICEIFFNLKKRSGWVH